MTGVVIASAGLGICLTISLACCVGAEGGGRRVAWACITAGAAFVLGFFVLGFFVGMAWALR